MSQLLKTREREKALADAKRRVKDKKELFRRVGGRKTISRNVDALLSGPSTKDHTSSIDITITCGQDTLHQKFVMLFKQMRMMREVQMMRTQ